MEPSPETPIGLIASEMEAAIPYFEKFRIDYTCQGNLSLLEACDRVGMPVEEALEALRTIEKEEPVHGTTQHWTQRSMADIIGFILSHHHRFSREMIEKSNGLLERLPPVYGFDHPQLVFLKNLFKEMGDELKTHMSKEEEVIFPYLVEREKAEADGRTIPNPFLDHPLFRQPLRVLEWEHQMAEMEWGQVHLLTNEFTPPSGTGSNYRSLYGGLKALEQDLHRHMHLENNVLFKRAIDKGWLE